MPIEIYEVIGFVADIVIGFFTASNEDDKFEETDKKSFEICISEIEKLDSSERAKLLKYLKENVGSSDKFDKFFKQNFESFQYPIFKKLLVDAAISEELTTLEILSNENFIDSIVVDSEIDNVFYFGKFLKIQQNPKKFQDSLSITFLEDFETSGLSNNFVNKISFNLLNGDVLSYEFKQSENIQIFENRFEIEIENFKILKQIPTKYLKT